MTPNLPHRDDDTGSVAVIVAFSNCGLYRGCTEVRNTVGCQDQPHT